MEAITVLIVDDHALVRRGLKLMLQTAHGINVVGEAADGAEAIRLAIQKRPTVTLLDITMPAGLDGFLTATALQNEHPDGEIILLTMHDEEAYVKRALEIGVRGFLSKNTDPDEMVEAIRSVAKGRRVYRTYLKDEVIRGMIQQSKKKDASILSRREEEIARCTALGYSLSEIGERLNISPKTVENHRGRIMQKLQLNHRHELVQYVLKNRLMDE
ncbi:response regulator transcription factor [Exiguobacterium sp. SH5S13]|uniref:response regulator transcription factor n=1 Tax=Exiguobacterium sp. SH5S13 TaxID=2510959 RepID=UPI00087778A5|nr:response regulator transcription factor [Exiguobacterium sp. SH5S13]TCI56221.1 response regulator transcription factor [Exiguobacterium sp. SH5S13]